MANIEIDEMTYSELCIEYDDLREKIRVFQDRKQEVVERRFALMPLINASEQMIKQANG